MSKVLHVLSSDKYSGAENVVIEIIKNYSSNYHGIYCSPRGDIENYLVQDKVDNFMVEALTIKNLRKVIKEVKPDIIHAHDFKASVKVTVLNTDAKIISHLHHNPSWIQSINLKTILYGICMRIFSSVLVVSEAIANELKVRKKLKSKIVNVNNPLSFKEIKRKSQEFIPDIVYEIIFVGRLSEEKNTELLLEIYKEIINVKKNIKIGIVGDGQDRQQMEEYVKEFQLENNIDFLGFQKNPFPYMKNAKLMIMPSKREGFGLVAVEAMFFKVPVLATPVGGLEEIIGKNSGLLCKTKEEFVDLSLMLLKDQEKYDLLAAKIDKKLVTKYDIVPYIKKLEKIYDKILCTEK